MFSNIEDYAIIGDCETAALVNRNGSIDWLCWPAFDSDACFTALLGTKDHGRWLIAPDGPIKNCKRRYRGDSLILETTLETEDGGAITLIDFMPPRGSASDIVRIVRGDRGTVKMRMELIIRFGFGSAVPWVKRHEDGRLLAICGADMAVLHSPVDTHGQNLTTVAQFEIHEGDSLPFVLTYGPSHLSVPAAIDVEAALKDTEQFWSEWSGRCTYRGEHRDLVMRSLITLKALIYAPSGGIVAAPTTSLPEKLGGSRNWDYRYCWLRDATFTLLVLMNSGYTDEARAWHRWLLRAVAGSPAEMQIMYGIMGQRRLLEWEAEWLPGYGGALPVRIGNAAHAQLQLDVYGELIDSFHQTRVAKLDLEDGTWAVECQILDHVAEVWNKADHGIWERRGNGKHYVLSKVMCWVAFDRAIKSAEMAGLEAPLDRWKALRHEIHCDVCEKGFDPRENTFVESYGSDTLDGAILLLPAVGFLPVDDPRIRGTVAATERHLMRDGFVLRHDPREVNGEVQPSEGAFLACTLWLAEAYIQMGELVRAEELLNRVIGVANDVGLLAEEYDSGAGRQTGNFPQALTHIALIAVAQNLANAKRPEEKKARERAR